MAKCDFPMIVIILLICIVIILVFCFQEGYDSPLYTGINLNKAFAVRSTEITVDPKKAAKLVAEKQIEEKVRTDTDVTLYKNPIVINERDADIGNKPMGVAVPSTFFHKNILKENMIWFVPETPPQPQEQSKGSKQNIYIDYFQPTNDIITSVNPFKDVPIKREGYGVGPFSVSPRFGITPNFCCIGNDGKACYSKNCKMCQNCFEQDEPLGGGIKARPSEDMYTGKL